MTPPRVVVVGSINLDMRVRVAALPEPGATVLGSSLATGPGGKGANQAVAAARLGGAVSFVGSVGSDEAGAQLRAALEMDGVKVTGLSVSPGPSGLALIEVDDAGQNRIVVVPGANQYVTPASVAEKWLDGADVILLQLEIPADTVRHAAAMGKAAGALVVLNAAPAAKLSPQDLVDVDLLVVNEVEAAAMLAGLGPAYPATGESSQPPAASLAAALTALVPTAIVTLGANGAVWAERGAATWPVRHATLGTGAQAAFAVKPVDTTGAGDTFVGALAVRLGAGDDMRQAVRYACAAGALATTRAGAQEAAPSAAAVEAFLAASGQEPS